MKPRCSEGRYGCKYRGDLFEVCGEYYRGHVDGDPIYAEEEFPIHCKDCEHRDFDFCLFQSDLICFNEQDPFDCRADMSNDRIGGLELMQKQQEAIKKACLKRNILYDLLKKR